MAKHAAVATKPPQSPVVRVSIKDLSERVGKPVSEIERLILEDTSFPSPHPDGYSISEVLAYFRRPENATEPAAAETSESVVHSVLMQLPLAEPVPGKFITRMMGHFECKLHRERELPGMRWLLQGLIAEGATDHTGKPITNQQSAAQYLFRMVTDRLNQILKSSASESAS